jgi:hypothetical protein
MPKVDDNKSLIEKLKKLVEVAEFLAIPERKKWLELADTLAPADLHQAYAYFEKASTDLEDKKLEIVYKAGLGNEYIDSLKSLAKEYKKNTIQKEESHLRKTTENPEDVLKQLDDL